MVPPFVGVAVNVTDVPEQIAPDGEAAMAILAVKIGLVINAPETALVALLHVPVTTQ